MKKQSKNLELLIENLNERAKELNCLYNVEKILKNYNAELEDIFKKLIKVIPPGWQYSKICKVKINYKNLVFQSGGFKETDCFLSANIIVEKKIVGKIQVFYIDTTGLCKEDPFLPDEKKLLKTITERVGNYIYHKKLKQTVMELDTVKDVIESHKKKDWKIIIDLIKATDSSLFLRISRKMMNYLCLIGIDKARELLLSFEGEKNSKTTNSTFDLNIPSKKRDIESMTDLSDQVFIIASEYLSDEDILKNFQKWIQEDKLDFLILALESLASSLNDIQNAISRYRHLGLDKTELSLNTNININVLLIYRLFTEQLEFINIAKNYVNVKDFYYIMQHIIFPQNSHGKLGGKSAGIFLAYNILKNAKGDNDQDLNIKIPKTWCITSDTMQHFLHYNNLEEAFEQKYKSIEQIREEYGNIIQIFKNSHFPNDMINGLSLALDDFGENPIVVRSSSLLEDRVGAAFSGKYKSLFLANQGSKNERLNALMDAVAEIYASTFGPDPIEYRKERGLLDFHEEMALIIQEVVGTKVGDYFLPSYAGVAFSNNEFRWSPRIKREDGLVRMVPGLGTRSVDRLSDDYPILTAPGQPNLKVNITSDEILRYSPRQIDVINLKDNSFETIEITDLLKVSGNEYPVIEKIVSVYEENRFSSKPLFNLNFKEDDLIVTFNGLISGTPFLKKMKSVLDILQEKTNMPVDIEFASDGKDFYLLQCRAQCYSKDNIPSIIPRDIAEENIIFNAKKYVSNGKLKNISHIVYVDPDMYNSLETIEELRSIGRAVENINKVLPKKKFILMGPGRWGSRGDIKLGVNITYSGINNTAMLIEIAKKKGNYTPSENILRNLLPEFSSLEDVIKVIDIRKVTDGKILKILMNADSNEALAYLSFPTEEVQITEEIELLPSPQSENHWRWRSNMAEQIAGELDPGRFGVKGIYIFGSTKNAVAGPASDIDILIHFRGTEKQKKELLNWLEGWSLCLAEINYQKTGFKSDGLLDVHIITDDDIKKKTSYAIKIDAVTNAARPLKMKDIS
jgi:predicted nucleotidyltransferase